MDFQEILQKAERACTIYHSGNHSPELREALEETVCAINQAVFFTDRLEFQKERADEETFGEELTLLVQIWNEYLLSQKMPEPERTFTFYYLTFRYVDEEILKNRFIDFFQQTPEAFRDFFISADGMSIRERYTFLTADLNWRESDFSLIEQYVHMMKEHVEDYRWLFENLQDYRSRIVLNTIVSYWFSFDMGKLQALTEGVFPDYFDLDVMRRPFGELILADLGAYIGDTVASFVKMFPNYRKIYSYEITPVTFEQLKNNLQGIRDLELRQKGVSGEAGRMYVEEDIEHAGNSLKASGTVPVEVVTLDEDISEPIDIIKMDIEGAEKDALLGARNHIEKEKPQLMISAYHLPADLFDIPKMIHEMRPDYKLYLRFNGHYPLWPVDYVILAV